MRKERDRTIFQSYLNKNHTMSKFDQAKLKVAINEIIQASDGLDAIEPKDLRAECEDKLRLEKGTLDSATNKALCDSMVKEAMALKSKSKPTGPEDETKKKKEIFPTRNRNDYDTYQRIYSTTTHCHVRIMCKFT